jgi:hypothetical protein
LADKFSWLAESKKSIPSMKRTGFRSTEFPTEFMILEAIAAIQSESEVNVMVVLDSSVSAEVGFEERKRREFPSKKMKRPWCWSCFNSTP